MFEKLREAFSSLTKVVSEKKLSEKDLDEALFNFQLTLLESDVAQEVVENLVAVAQGPDDGPQRRAFEGHRLSGER